MKRSILIIAMLMAAITANGQKFSDGIYENPKTNQTKEREYDLYIDGVGLDIEEGLNYPTSLIDGVDYYDLWDKVSYTIVYSYEFRPWRSHKKEWKEQEDDIKRVKNAVREKYEPVEILECGGYEAFTNGNGKYILLNKKIHYKDVMWVFDSEENFEYVRYTITMEYLNKKAKQRAADAAQEAREQEKQRMIAELGL